MAKLSDFAVEALHRWQRRAEIAGGKNIDVSNQCTQRRDDPARHAEPHHQRNGDQQRRDQHKDLLQTAEAGKQRLPSLLGVLRTSLLKTGVVIVEIGLECLCRNGKKGVDRLGFHQPVSLLFQRAIKELITVDQAFIFWRVERLKSKPGFIRRGQRLLGFVHQAVPAAVRTGRFILHKVDPGAVEQIACAEKRNARFVCPHLLQMRLLVQALIVLRAAKRGGKEKGGGDLQSRKECDDAKNPGQQTKLLRCDTPENSA